MRAAMLISVCVAALALGVAPAGARGETAAGVTPPRPPPPAPPGSPAEASAARPQVAFDVTLERSALHASDRVPFALWVANESATAVTGVELSISAPPRDVAGVARQDHTCRVATTGPLRLFDLPAFKSRSFPGVLCTAGSVREGEFNVLFVLRYHWRVPERGGADGYDGYKATEKRVALSFIAAEGAAGASLGLVALLIPGVLFFLVLRLTALPGLERLNTADVGALTVAVSLLCAYLVTRLMPAYRPETISRGSLLALCLAAAAAALVLRGVVALACALGRVRRRDRVVLHTDSIGEALGKALQPNRLVGRAQAASSIRFTLGEEGGQVEGSRLVEAEDGYALLGWFSVECPDAAMRQRLDRLLAARRYREVLAAAPAPPTLRAGLRIAPPGGELADTGQRIKFLKADEIIEPSCQATNRGLPLLVEGP